MFSSSSWNTNFDLRSRRHNHPLQQGWGGLQHNPWQATTSFPRSIAIMILMMTLMIVMLTMLTKIRRPATARKAIPILANLDEDQKLPASCLALSWDEWADLLSIVHICWYNRPRVVGHTWPMLTKDLLLAYQQEAATYWSHHCNTHPPPGCLGGPGQLLSSTPKHFKQW